ncbi:MAG: hypothetical protein ACK4Q6_04440 [Tepidimonas ignava]|uniref:Uncharacterized protein n=1 Tax=Tepidimonas ignava TaxID=114249 RepID=A0A4V2UWJ9_9BURK|nr:hypothetical protein [Tepidimonas ignava]TCS99947.1 hypothetical protein EDC36_101221 [Tepidimonas ignava]TSE23332.1 hypothetical protein Tigna_00715 [Tepidimonas ignava]
MDRPRDATSRAPVTARLWALWAAGVMAFNFPLLGVWATLADEAGLPAPWAVATFGVWAVLIAVLGWWMERAPD